MKGKISGDGKIGKENGNFFGFCLVLSKNLSARYLNEEYYV